MMTDKASNKIINQSMILEKLLNYKSQVLQLAWSIVRDAGSCSGEP